MNPTGIEPATTRLVAQCLNQLLCTLCLTSVLDGGACLTPHLYGFTPENDPVPVLSWLKQHLNES